MADGPEFSRPVAVDRIGADSRTVTITADDQECAALALRFGLAGLSRLAADYLLVPSDTGGFLATGRIRADVVQICVATGVDVPARIDAPFVIRFDVDTPGSDGAGEIELDQDDCDVMAIEDGRIDMGEAAAQTLALELDPFPRAPGADDYLRQRGVVPDDEAGGALAAGLRSLLKGGD